MSFINVFEELSKLYEAEKPEADEAAAVNTADEESAGNEALTEAAKDEADEEVVVEDEPVGEEPAEEPAEDAVEVEPKRVILECANCGAITIRGEAEVVIDEETDLANVDEACQYCEETAGYEIVGVVAPYEVDDMVTVSEESDPETEELEEFLDVDVDLPVSINAGW